MVHYHLGYYWLKKGRRGGGRECFRAAGRMSPDYCFPFRLESIDVLRSAMAHNPATPARPTTWETCCMTFSPRPPCGRGNEPGISTASGRSCIATSAGLTPTPKHDNTKAIASLETAVACDPRDPRLYAELDTLYDAVNANLQKRLALLERNHAAVVRRDDALLREISLLILFERYDRR